MSVAELQKYTAVSKYARYVQEWGRREVWEETVDRYLEMLLEKYPERTALIEETRQPIYKMEVVPSMRGLQFGGPPILKRNERQYNCCSSHCDRLRFFAEAWYLLLCGCGTGFSVQAQHLKFLPKFSQKRRYGASLPTKVYKARDSIEGWADCANVLLSSFHETPVKGFEEYYDCEVDFDLSDISPKGLWLSHGVGKTPGPKGLWRALQKSRGVLLDALAAGLERLDDIHAYDIVMHEADSVVSGGVRRSATICLFDAWSSRMLTAKVGSWHQDNPQRGRSNNSAVLVRNKTNWDDFVRIFEATRQYGEPGFYFSDDADIIPNPCFRGSVRLATSRGLVTVRELYETQEDNWVAADDRVGVGDNVNEWLGVSMRQATPVKLTQKNADIYRLTTTDGHSVEVTQNHEFPTPRGRKKLSELKPKDILYLQSGVGGFGTRGSYEEGLVLGLLVGDGTICRNKAFIDVWEDDFDALEDIRSVVHSFIDKFEQTGFSTTFPMPEWTNQTTLGAAKKRMGGVRLYRCLNQLCDGNIEHAKQRVPECVWQGTYEMMIGYLQGLIFTDGTVYMTGKGKKQTLSLRISQSNKALLEDVQVLLQNFGVVSTLYLRRDEHQSLLPDGKGGQAYFDCKAAYEVVVSRPMIITVLSHIGVFGRKGDLVKKLLDERGWRSRKYPRFTTKVKSIEYVATEDVYCLCQHDTNSVIANGCVVGNCVEIALWPTLETNASDPAFATYDGPVRRKDGKLLLSGWQFCNLSSIGCKTLRDETDFYERCRLASLLGTWQAGFTDFTYLGPVSERITRKEALLGVSLCGVMHKPALLLNEDILCGGAKIVVETNAVEAAAIGINPAARSTCVKPDGNLGSTLGSFSGCHPGKFRKGFRIVQANRDEAPYQHFREINPDAVEGSVWSSNLTDDCIRFCAEYEGLLEEDLSAVEFLEYVRLLQRGWVQNGKVTSRCSIPESSHNVSNTVRVRPDEWGSVAEHIYQHRESYSGVSFVGVSGDRDFPQAPFTSVYSKAEQEEMYGAKALDFATQAVRAALVVFPQRAGSASAALWDACDVVLGLRDMELDSKQQAWCTAVSAFASSFFKGSETPLQKAVLCLKDAYNWSLYERLKSLYRPVDYSTMTEEDSFLGFVAEPACAGGACLV